MRKRFAGQFDALTKTGTIYCNSQRFRPLSGRGKPLWEFKEFDHRVYCLRSVTDGGTVDIVLLSGWVKQKEGKSQKEDREIKRAMELYQEFVNERGGKA
jgi:membrane-associated protease RseP (regulator of RpoE activity)